MNIILPSPFWAGYGSFLACLKQEVYTYTSYTQIVLLTAPFLVNDEKHYCLENEVSEWFYQEIEK